MPEAGVLPWRVLNLWLQIDDGRALAEQLRRELNEPWLEKFWRDNPIGVGTLEPESDETVEQSSTIARP